MRKINKEEAPEILRAAVRPSSPDEIKEKVYNDKTVKNQLITNHHNKCAYCECRISQDYGGFGHIEHFRPKSAYTIYPDNTQYKPAYYWLAYDWDNLLLSCAQCNSSYKKNHFPLIDETTRNIIDKDISKEIPLLINPCRENPADFIEFHEHILAPKMSNGEKSVRGAATIEILKLNERQDLKNERRKVWERYKSNLDALQSLEIAIESGRVDKQLGEMVIDIIENEIKELTAPDSEFSGMFALQNSSFAK